MSWYQAVAFSRWLDVKYHEAGLLAGDLHIRLPLEEEWEYAARGTNGREYPWGDSYRVGHANLDEQEKGVGPYFLYKTTAVGLYPQGASPFGVMDMAGNLWEWCLNNYDDPKIIDASNTSFKVLRGGSFFGSQPIARSSYRANLNPLSDDDYCGCRLVVAPIAPL